MLGYNMEAGQKEPWNTLWEWQHSLRKMGPSRQKRKKRK